jgi:thiol-disulfide isomerase/thioredoxin
MFLIWTCLALHGTAQAAESTGLALSWGPGTLSLHVDTPTGEHIAEESPALLQLQLDATTVEVAIDGQGLAQGLQFTLGPQSKHQLKGHLVLALCEDNGTRCRQVQGSFEAEFGGRRGKQTVALIEGADQAHTESSPERNPEEAFQAAQAADKLVLLDFSAVWCPPCQLLATEILHNEDHADLLNRFEVVVLDADSPSSFAWKDRYKVGGYPTVVIANADGQVLSRMTGYESEASYLAWLETAAGTEQPISALLADLAGVPQAELARAAKRLMAEGHNEQAQTLVDRLPLESPARTLLQFELAPSLAGLTVLATEQQDQILAWIWIAVYDLFPTDAPSPELVQLVRDAATQAMLDQPVGLAAELAYVLAELATDPQTAQQLYALAASLHQASFTGNAQADRGRYGFQATLLEQAGQPERALAVIDQAIAAFPQEFTYHYRRAGLLQGADRLEEAAISAQAALDHAHGDMSLRAGRRLASIQADQGQLDLAIATLKTTLATAERPEQGIEVRTWRYLDQAEADLAELEARQGG